MNVLVTGGCGYIGSHVAWALTDAGHHVTIVDNLSTGTRENAPPPAVFFEYDVGDYIKMAQLLSDCAIDAVIHLAGKIIPAESLCRPLDYFHENTANSITLLRAMANARVGRLIFSSTAAVYGASTSAQVREDMPTKPITPYGASKLMVEEIMAASGAAHGLRSTALRYFNVAGADPLKRCGPRGPNPGHLIRNAIDVALKRRDTLSVFGTDYDTPDGTCVRDFIHVSDLAAAHLSALAALDHQDGFRVLNCGYGHGASVLEVILATESVTGRKLPYRIAPRRAGDPPAVIADSAALRRLGTWAPLHTDLTAIIDSAYQWELRDGADR